MIGARADPSRRHANPGRRRRLPPVPLRR
jgi:hypothetical protein